MRRLPGALSAAVAALPVAAATFSCARPTGATFRAGNSSVVRPKSTR
jgi:hypothetical protein